MPDVINWEENPRALAELTVILEEFIGFVGDDLLDRAQKVVPKETWSLHDSLKKEVGRGAPGVVFVDVGVDESYTSPVGRHPADYVMFVEKGTSRMAAEPFLVPSLLQTVGNFNNVRGVKHT